ncbi:enoyl-CoA hydratase-related protein [Gordonia sp. HY002]|uniref:enoyl-CoA hydratase/isomerase family protein n=1 Tax=Gordonia zhenghanii TaxID=2911516 RepID=UPI001EF12591|nr:enoyl-CoA hydratase-related protein [Gordonia zhenghanii]MCF8570874.1 enoyl-CoA hydratase-related protein [Gordonia zhenghanii]MCF8608073.1 enoyl-CoA hydratase-related protein [Gordonia zhenghanii]
MISETRHVGGVCDGIDDDGVARIEIDRPAQMNALDGAASARIIELCGEWADRSDVRVVVISGRGGAFCAGADVAGMASDSATGGGFDETQARAIIESGSRLIGALRSLSVPVIAAVDGPAVGIGASLAVAADLVYATARSYFLLAFVNIGLMPDGGATALFTASLGRARANAMALLGEKLPAREAYAAGLLTAVADDEDGLGALVDRATSRLLRKSPTALAVTKEALDAHSLAGYDDAIHREIAGQTSLLQSPEFHRALAGFGDR